MHFVFAFISVLGFVFTVESLVTDTGRYGIRQKAGSEFLPQVCHSFSIILVSILLGCAPKPLPGDSKRLPEGHGQIGKSLPTLAEKELF